MYQCGLWLTLILPVSMISFGIVSLEYALMSLDTERPSTNIERTEPKLSPSCLKNFLLDLKAQLSCCFPKKAVRGGKSELSFCGLLLMWGLHLLSA